MSDQKAEEDIDMASLQAAKQAMRSVMKQRLKAVSDESTMTQSRP
jgi:hypothetical protein